MSKNRMRRLLALLLCLILCLSALPASAFAEEETAEPTPIEEPEDPIEIPAPEDYFDEPEDEIEEEELIDAGQDAEEVKDEAADWSNNPANGVPQPVESALSPGSVVYAQIASAGQVRYYSFTPSVTGVYRFFSDAAADSYGYLYASDWTMIESNDDGGGNRNFKIQRTLYAGATYYYGACFYFNDTGTIKATLLKLDGWNKINGLWYYCDANGNFLTGWKTINGVTYYFADDGVMAINGSAVTHGQNGQETLYFFKSNGAWDNAPGWKQDSYGQWYYADNDGKLITGWSYIGSSWYFFFGNGVMAADGGWQTDYDSQGVVRIYFFTASGAWGGSPGWKKDSGGTWYYAGSGGRLVTGWQTIGGKKYYFDDYSGAMYAGGIIEVDGVDYFFTASGALAGEGWQYLYEYAPGANSQIAKKVWYYTNAQGMPVKGWRLNEGKWYYFDPETYKMVSGCMREIGGRVYYFAASGAMQTGWIKEAGTMDLHGSKIDYVHWYYANSGGELLKGLQVINGVTYYFNEIYYTMFYDAYWYINGKNYFFTSSGALAGAGWQSVQHSVNGSTVTTWFYTNADGSCVEGWKKVGRYWYYFTPEMLADGLYEINGQYEYFKPSGIWVGAPELPATHVPTGVSGWVRFGESLRYMENDTFVKGWKKIDNHWYYFDDAGALYEGWVDYGGKRYYCAPEMLASCLIHADDAYYIADASGAVITKQGWQKLSSTRDGYTVTEWYYVEAGGKLAMGWRTIHNKMYYFDPDMYADGTFLIGYYYYTFDASGAWTGESHPA